MLDFAPDPVLSSTPSEHGLAGLGGMLAATLPIGSMVVVCWTDLVAGFGLSSMAGASPEMHSYAQLCLEGSTPDEIDGHIASVWNEEDARIALVASVVQPLPVASVDVWLALAKRTIASAFLQAQAQTRIQALQQSQRLQKALYEISDLAGSKLEMPEMLRRIHEVVAGLMVATNFYIVLYEENSTALRFLYFADQRDPYRPAPTRAIPLEELENSLTLALLRHGKPMLGPSSRVRAQLGMVEDATHGPDSADWLGVPMLHGDTVTGAIVVQSYDQPGCYSQEECALLEYVTQHIRTALDRKYARAELERHVVERTRDLQKANEGLHEEIAERQRAEKLQRALFRISELSATSGTMERFYEAVHSIVGELLYAKNLYIALVCADGDQIEFPYSVDEYDATRQTRAFGKGLTEFVISTGQALLADRTLIAALEASGSVRSIGSQAHCWLGVPLWQDNALVGAITVQSYTPHISFTLSDQELLTFVSQHIGNGLARRRAQEHLKIAHAELESRVESRTRELAKTNRELRAQVAERMRAEEQLKHQALHDDLTGLPNRHCLLQCLGAAIMEVQAPDALPFAVLFLDLDGFKLVNDSMGHAAGDQMLVEIGKRISQVIARYDVVARLGGDEFAILAMNIGERSHIEALASRVLQALGQPMWIDGRELFTSGSIGVALWQPHYRQGDEMLRDADAAMYRAKASGRDRSAIFDEEMRADAVRLLDLEADLRRAIRRDAFVAHFQPILRLANDEIVGHEALLRWNHETRGTLWPAQFIGMEVDSGLIEQVDWLMYRHVMVWMRSHDKGYVSINVSPRHFRSEEFAERLLRMADEIGVDAHRLRIEITEAALLDDAPRTLRTLNVLRKRGVLALLDDFGTGFSALSYLHRFPIQAIKIDQSFVAGLEGVTSEENLALVRAVLALADTLNIDTIAEGIETEQQRKKLRDLGCMYGQGFLFG